ncbi:hypothetical protein Tco_0066326 [Tanacetum coccineum]|uniref:Reverse transcriptase domain-containing protein n=1 Tax=Tanacetum coccineum TaxID=301880 RepID=A0ABQ4X4D1_9ASTR
MTQTGCSTYKRVNPKIHEVIKKEVIKLLDAGLIYPISDSLWVSLVHCVPKKGDMTVIENDNNDTSSDDVRDDACMMAIFHDMIEETMEVFMDDFSAFEDSFLSFLSHLDKMLRRYSSSFYREASPTNKWASGGFKSWLETNFREDHRVEDERRFRLKTKTASSALDATIIMDDSVARGFVYRPLDLQSSRLYGNLSYSRS